MSNEKQPRPRPPSAVNAYADIKEAMDKLKREREEHQRDAPQPGLDFFG
jgi:hypothetical protein